MPGTVYSWEGMFSGRASDVSVYLLLTTPTEEMLTEIHFSLASYGRSEI